MGEFVYVLSPCVLFKWTLLKIWPFIPPHQPPLIFTARSYGDLSSWCWNPGLCGLAWVWDRWLPRYPSQVLSNIHEHGTTYSAATVATTPHSRVSVTPTLLPILMNVASLNLWLSGSTQLNFLMLFVLRNSCNLSVVVQGDKACLPMLHLDRIYHITLIS